MSQADPTAHPPEDDIRQAWWKLENEGLRLRQLHLRTLFAENAARGSAFSCRGGGLFLDYAKEKLDGESLAALFAFADTYRLAAQRDALFADSDSTQAGDDFYASGRAQIALRKDQSGTGDADRKWLHFAKAVRSGSEKGANGERFTDLVHIGSGGAIQGARVLVEALSNGKGEDTGNDRQDSPRAHFLDGADGAETTRLLTRLSAATTLVIVSSRSMTTPETLTKARSLCDWLEQSLGTEISAHLVAVTSETSTARAQSAALGIANERIFTFPAEVCGRNSVWGATALSAAIALGEETIREFLSGGAELDEHFRTASLTENLPVLLALISIWRRNIMGWPTVALVPYEARLGSLVEQFRQLEMESNGKSIQRTMAACPRPTAPVVWGGVGPEAQHSFFQALHQGTDVTPTDFLLPATPQDEDSEAHAEVLAHCLAQSRALAFGLAESEVATMLANTSRRETAPRALSGDRPSTTLVFEKTNARNLGRLMALWEHKIFCQAVLWNINPYDQHGVEYGKELAQVMLAEMRGEEPTPQAPALPRFTQDSSTPHLVKVLIGYESSK